MLHLKVVFGRVPAYGGPKTASLDDERVVHIEREDGSSANTGSPEDFAPVGTPAEVIVPAMTPRMEQRDDPATYGILRRHLDPLEFVARMACMPSRGFPTLSIRLLLRERCDRRPIVLR
jgi:hypothetical protein